MAMVDRRDGQLSRLMIYLIEDISTIYCVLSVYQTLFVSKLLGAIGSDCDKCLIDFVEDAKKGQVRTVCFRACPVSRWSLSINISSQESIWYLGGWNEVDGVK